MFLMMTNPFPEAVQVTAQLGVRQLRTAVTPAPPTHHSGPFLWLPWHLPAHQKTILG